MNDATRLLTQLHAKQISSVELVEESIRRIEKYDPQLNAVVVRDFNRARAAAVLADQALARGDKSALLGLPITVKESYAVAGLSTSWGVPGMQHQVSKEDAVVVQRLRNAGAIILGKTNVPMMLGDWQTENPIYGVTNNPWDVSKTPGGSSGGSAAALAAGYVSLEFGSDLNGSLRFPAHCCGVFAHNPSYGLVPSRGHAPSGTPILSVSPAMDFAVCGPLARSAEDLKLALDVIAGPDDDKATGYKLALPSARHARLKDYRVLVLTHHPLGPTSHDTDRLLQRCIEYLAKQGCTIARSCPDMPDLTQIAHTFVKMLMALLFVDAPDEEYQKAQTRMSLIRKDDSSLMADIARGQVLTHRDYIKCDRVRSYIAHQWRRVFESYDVVLCPAAPMPAFSHDNTDMDSRKILIDGKDVDYGEVGLWNALATLTGQPATVMPIGLSSEGMPIGMQIIGPYLEDYTTIKFAELLEVEFARFSAPPDYSS